MATQAPGFRVNRPRPAAPLSFSAQARDLPMLASVMRRGPINRARVLTNGKSDFRKVYGGAFGDEPGPYGASRWFENMPFVGARVVGTGSKYGSRRILDYLGCATIMMAQRNPGAWGSACLPVVTKVSTTIKATATNTAGTLLSSSTEIGLAGYTGVEPGDVFFATDGTNTCVGRIWGVEPGSGTTGRVKIFTKAGWCSGTVALGGTFAISSHHLAQTTSTQALASGATSLTLKSTKNIKIGSILTVAHSTSGGTGGTEAAVLVVTAVTAEGVSFSAYSGSTITTAGIVSSHEFYFDVTDTLEDGSTVTERIGPLSLSDTHKGVYLSQVAGTSLAFVAGSTIGNTLAVTGTVVSNGTSCILDTGVGASVAAGDWLQIGSSPKVVVQVKSVSADTVYFESVGVLASSVTAGSAVLPLTLTVTDSDDNKSELIILQEMNAAAVGASTTTELDLATPRPVTLGALTGGANGSAPSGSATILGTATPGAKTGIRMAEDLEDLPRISWLAAPGFDGASSANRASLDNDVIAWCETNFVQYLTSCPTSITKPEEAEAYRHATLGADSADVCLYFQRIYVRSPTENSPRIKMPPDVAQLWLAAYVAATEGIQHPKANRPYPADVVSIDVPVTSLEHGRLDDLGINCLVRENGRVVPMGADTLYRARTDLTKLHHSNASESLKFIIRSLQQSPAMKGFTFTEGTIEKLEDLQDSANQWSTTLPVGMLQSQEGAIEFVANETTTTDANFASGDANLFLYVSLAGAWKRVNLTPYLMTGSVRERRAS